MQLIIFLISGSPFQCQISSPARIIDVDSLDKVSVGANCEFTVESGTSPVVEILGPARRPVPAQVIPTPIEEDQFGTPLGINQKYKIKFVPVDVGDHSIEVRYYNKSYIIDHTQNIKSLCILLYFR